MTLTITISGRGGKYNYRDFPADCFNENTALLDWKNRDSKVWEIDNLELMFIEDVIVEAQIDNGDEIIIKKSDLNFKEIGFEGWKECFRGEPDKTSVDLIWYYDVTLYRKYRFPGVKTFDPVKLEIQSVRRPVSSGELTSPLSKNGRLFLFDIMYDGIEVKGDAIEYGCEPNIGCFGPFVVYPAKEIYELYPEAPIWWL